MRVSTELTRARRSQAALALDPIPASKVQSDPLEFAELDKHNSSGSKSKILRARGPTKPLRWSVGMHGHLFLSALGSDPRIQERGPPGAD
jgi:hypothetical protein